MIDSFDEALRCAENALRDADGARWEPVADLMRFLDTGGGSFPEPGPWTPTAAVTGVRLATALRELGLRQEAEAVFGMLHEQLRDRGMPEDEWHGRQEGFVNCLGTLGMSLGRAAAARAVLGYALTETSPRPTPAAVVTRANLAAVEATLGNADAAVRHALTARALLERLPPSDDPATESLHTLLDTVEHRLLGFAPRYGDHAARTLATLADRTERLLDEDGGHGPQALQAVVRVAVMRAEAAVEGGDTDALETAAKVVEVAAQRLASLLGADHPQVLTVRADLAAVQIEAARAVRSPERLERAVRLLAATAERMEHRLGPGHPRTVGALTNLVAAQVEMVRAVPAPGRARRTAEALNERAARFQELLGARHPVTVLVSASATACRRMAAGDDAGHGSGGTTLVRTLVDAPGDWSEDRGMYCSFQAAVDAVGQASATDRTDHPHDGIPHAGRSGAAVPSTPPSLVPGTPAYALGSVVWGVVSDIDEDEVELEVGDVHVGVVPLHDLHDLPDPGALHPSEIVAFGDLVEAVVVGREPGDEGRLRLSMREPLLSAARQRRARADGQDALSGGATVTGLVIGVTSEGLTVEVGNDSAFLPAADIELEPVEDWRGYLGRILDVKVWVPLTGPLILSRQAWLREADVLTPREWLAHVHVGQVRTATVRRVEWPDVVVDLEGFDGVLDSAAEEADFAPGARLLVHVSAVDPPTVFAAPLDPPPGGRPPAQD